MLEINLNLKKYCIETATKRCYNRLLSEYFRGKEGDSESEEKLALLQKALTRFDFSSLRSVHKDLAGKSSARIVLKDNGGNLPSIIIDGHPIDMESHLKK